MFYKLLQVRWRGGFNFSWNGQWNSPSWCYFQFQFLWVDVSYHDAFKISMYLNMHLRERKKSFCPGKTGILINSVLGVCLLDWNFVEILKEILIQPALIYTLVNFILLIGLLITFILSNKEMRAECIKLIIQMEFWVFWMWSEYR